MLKKLTKPRNIIKLMVAVSAIWLVAEVIQDTQAAYVEPRQDDAHSWQHDDEDPWAEWRQGGPGPPPPLDDNFWTDPNIPSNVARWVEDSFPTDERGNRIYPDYYGGMYFDVNNNGRLVLLRVSSATGPMPTFTNFPDVFVRDVEFSYNELRAMIDIMNASGIIHINNINGYGIDIGANRIIVGLLEYSEEAIADFKNINEAFESNSNMFIFRQEGPIWADPGPPEPPPGFDPNQPPFDPRPPGIPGGAVPGPGIPPPVSAPPPDLRPPILALRPPIYGPQFSDEFMINYSRAIDTLERLNAHFPTNEIGHAIYPDYLGGMYINDDGNLVLLRVRSAVEPMPTFTYFADEILVRDVEFSYNELNAMSDFKMDFMDANFPSAQARVDNNLAGWGIDVLGNRIIVRLIVYSDEAIANFRSINEAFESNMFAFRQGYPGTAGAPSVLPPPGTPGGETPPPPLPGIPGPAQPGSPGAPGDLPVQPGVPPGFDPNHPPPPPAHPPWMGVPPPPEQPPAPPIDTRPPPWSPEDCPFDPYDLTDPGHPDNPANDLTWVGPEGPGGPQWSMGCMIEPGIPGPPGAPGDLPAIPGPGVPQEPAPPAANPPDGIPQEPAPPEDEQHPEEGGGHWNRRRWRNWRGRRWRNRPVRQQPVEEQQINQPNQWRNRPARRWRNHQGWNWNNPGNDNATEQEQHNAFGN